MPIYEYQCSDCRARFEKRRPMSQANDAAACPECGSEHTHRGISQFAAFSKSSGGTSSAVAGGSSCAGCGSRSCGTCSHH